MFLGKIFNVYAHCWQFLYYIIGCDMHFPILLETRKQFDFTNFIIQILGILENVELSSKHKGSRIYRCTSRMYEVQAISCVPRLSNI